MKQLEKIGKKILAEEKQSQYLRRLTNDNLILDMFYKIKSYENKN
jgi:hypothetical protein